jgi:hypothetical protein
LLDRVGLAAMGEDLGLCCVAQLERSLQAPALVPNDEPGTVGKARRGPVEQLTHGHAKRRLGADAVHTAAGQLLWIGWLVRRFGFRDFGPCCQDHDPPPRLRETG